ncbi:TPM domain-containing protein [Clostridium sp. PL3]|uniref:TPM domain-containing protein n=1 Tax=Clostridium thailandense TaxID=2794346 RepID=A0A949X3Q7_9CLOT|nr:TPM domain-containing protein [Clostridium thailandense]MBV7275089.1 TPM domain-containing protein [Clostridium thailandense]
MLKKSILIFFFFMFVIVFFKVSVYSKATISSPKLDTYVVDNANILSKDILEKLNSNLKSLKVKTDVPVYIITINELYGTDIDKYCQELVSSWDIKGNYVILLTSLKEKQYRLVTSNDLKPYITNNTIKDLSSYFNTNKYEDGMLYVANNISSTINSNTNKISPFDPYNFIWLAAVATIIVFLIKKAYLIFLSMKASVK